MHGQTRRRTIRLSSPVGRPAYRTGGEGAVRSLDHRPPNE